MTRRSIWAVFWVAAMLYLVALCCHPVPVGASEWHVGGQVAQGISDFGIGRNNTGKLGGLIVDYEPDIGYPFARHLRIRGFAGLGTTKNLASGYKFPIFAIQPGLRATAGPVFVDAYPFGIAYAPNPLSGSDYQFVFELGMGIHARENIDIAVFWKHLSNGDTMRPNPGLDYWGIGMTLRWSTEMQARKDNR